MRPFVCRIDGTLTHPPNGAASLRRIDARFLAPHAIRAATVYGELATWRDGLQRAGVALVAAPVKPDLAVTDTPHVEDAVASGARTIIVEGRGGARGLRGHSLTSERLLVRPF